MSTTNIIVRAFELAGVSRSIDEVRARLRRESYANIDAHLAGARIRADIRSRLQK